MSALYRADVIFMGRSDKNILSYSVQFKPVDKDGKLVSGMYAEIPALDYDHAKEVKKAWNQER